MAADAWVVFNAAKFKMGDGTIDLDTDGFRCALVTSSWTATSTSTAWSQISGNEVADGNGYSTHGYGMTATWTQNSSSSRFDSDNPNWTASGGSIVSRYAVIVHDADDNGALATTDIPIAYCLMDNAPADITQADGGTHTIAISASGVFEQE